jgi:hypothetical protein
VACRPPSSPHSIAQDEEHIMLVEFSLALEKNTVDNICTILSHTPIN